MTYSSDRFPKSWLLPVRAIWVVTAVVLFIMFIPGLGLAFEELATPCQGQECTALALNLEEAAFLDEIGLSLRNYAALEMGMELVLTLVFTSLAMLLIWQRRPYRMGVISSFFFLFLGPVFFGEGVRAFHRANPEVEKIVIVFTSLSVMFFILILHLFPDGRFYPRWNRYWVLPFSGLVVLEPILFPAGAQSYSASTFVVIWGMAAALIGLIFQVQRYRKISNRVQRQQTRWVLAGLISMFIGMAPWMIFVEIAPLDPGPTRVYFNLSVPLTYVFILMMPVAFVTSIQRYRLWDIDLIIRRSLQYALLTGALVLIYSGGVIVIQSIIQALTGQGESQAATVLTTLLVAALFNPLRRQAQDFIDRRFFRAKYDAEQALARFAVAARDEVDPGRLAQEILDVVGETMQPQSLTLWIAQAQRGDDTIAGSK